MCSKRDIYINKAIDKHGIKYDYSLIENVNKRIDIVRIICPNHGEFTQSLHKHICGDGCRKCGSALTGSKISEKAKNEFINKANEIHNNKYDYSLVKYENAKKNIIIICPKHGEFEQTPNLHLNRHGCRTCANDKTGERVFIPWEIQLKKFTDIHNDKYDYSLVEYMGVDINITVICPKHGEFSIRPADHKKRGCQKCSKENIVYKNKLSIGEFIEKSNKIHNYFYDYSKVKYNGCKNIIIIICPKHGDFQQTPQKHLLLCRGCKKCSIQNNIRKIKKKYSDDFIEKSNKVHNNKYTYEKSNYISSHTKVIVNCKDHGDFEITPNSHLSGQGCRLCANMERGKYSLISFEEYLPKMIDVWGDTYDYSKIDWKGSSFYIKLNCKKHGEFNIYPYNHIKGKGCTKCFNQYSKISIQWLNYLQVKYNIFIQHADNIGEFSIEGTRFKADGYCKQTNTIYEFLGDFWHGNPDLYDLLDINRRTNTTYLELYNETNDKKEIILSLGYNYVQIWENDWKKFIKTVVNVQRIKSYYY